MEKMVKVLVVVGIDKASGRPRVVSRRFDIDVIDENPASYFFAVSKKARGAVSKRYELFPFQDKSEVRLHMPRLDGQCIGGKFEKSIASEEGVTPLACHQLFSRPEFADEAESTLLKVFTDDLRKQAGFINAMADLLETTSEKKPQQISSI